MKKSEIIIDFENRLKKLSKDEEIILFDVTQPKPESTTTEKCLKPFTFYPFIPKDWSIISRGFTGLMLTFCIIFTVGIFLNSRMHHHKTIGVDVNISKSLTIPNEQKQNTSTDSTSHPNQTATHDIDTSIGVKIMNMIRDEIGKTQK